LRNEALRPGGCHHAVQDQTKSMHHAPEGHNVPAMVSI
jgi:hypothetical protein